MLDLGIAKSVGSEQDGKQTMTGHVVGSPDFMAPELISGVADARSYIYSPGCTLAYLLTGKNRSESQGGLPEAIRTLLARMTAGIRNRLLKIIESS